MNYFCIYWKIINRAINREENVKNGEMHHIIPRSEGGSNKKTNKVELTPKEHHLCHLCLIKLDICPKYCFRHLSSRQYINLKEQEKEKLHINKLK